VTSTAGPTRLPTAMHRPDHGDGLSHTVVTRPASRDLPAGASPVARSSAGAVPAIELTRPAMPIARSATAAARVTQDALARAVCPAPPRTAAGAISAATPVRPVGALGRAAAVAVPSTPRAVSAGEARAGTPVTRWRRRSVVRATGGRRTSSGSGRVRPAQERLRHPRGTSTKVAGSTFRRSPESAGGRAIQSLTVASGRPCPARSGRSPPQRCWRIGRA
jgi:hypothetical protein